MSPGFVLGVAAGLAGFALKTALGFGICWLVSLLVTSPAGRFLAWLSFLGGTATYWLWINTSLLLGTSLDQAGKHAAQGASVSVIGAWQIPTPWGFLLAIALPLLAGFYVLGLAYFLVRYLRKQLYLRWVLRFACAPPPEIAETFTALVRSLGLRHTKLLVLSGITSPATFGWFRPTILLPAECVNQNAAELEDVLRHELHHIRRRDSFANGFAAFCRAVLFFHPAVWYSMRKMQLERELACDLAVITEFPERRVRYAECLIRFARLNLSADGQPWGLDFAASSTHLNKRVRSVLRESRKLSAWLLSLRTSGGILLLAGFVAVAPSLAIVLSYAEYNFSQPAQTPLETHSTIKSRLKTKSKTQVATMQAPSDVAGASDKAREPEHLQLLKADPNFHVHLERTLPFSALGTAADALIAESDGSNNSTASNAPPRSTGRTKIPTPSVTSVVLDTVRQIESMPDHDHDHDNH